MQPSRAPKRWLCRRPYRRGKGTRIIFIAAGNNLPLAVSVQSVSPAECRLVEDVLAGSFLDEFLARLIGDKAYDSDPLDEKLATEYGIELITPNERDRKRPARMDANCAVVVKAGKWSGSSPGCTTFAALSLAGNTPLKTSSASSTSPAST